MTPIGAGSSCATASPVAFGLAMDHRIARTQQAVTDAAAITDVIPLDDALVETCVPRLLAGHRPEARS